MRNRPGRSLDWSAIRSSALSSFASPKAVVLGFGPRCGDEFCREGDDAVAASA